MTVNIVCALPIPGCDRWLDPSGKKPAVTLSKKTRLKYHLWTYNEKNFDGMKETEEMLTSAPSAVYVESVSLPAPLASPES